MGVLEQIGISARDQIGEIYIDATLEETSIDELQITEHPVELGAAITDHSFKRPVEVVLKCGWSDASVYAAANLISNLVSSGSISGLTSGSDYVSSVYSQLLALQETRTPFTITTGSRQYVNMLIANLVRVRDKTTANALMVTATCRQVIIVQTQATTLPAKANQADPSSTGQIDNTGTKQATAATPSAGGAVPMADWN
ncbi:phage baseplate protein [Robbsia andropogonis]|uniref:phage baseplate protein n=1 Tax=Robbsia andropogonis TaxID=28092 RepID=UPI003D1ACA89